VPSLQYDKHGITIYHRDASEVLPQLEAENIDLVVTDAPLPSVRAISATNT
jgi:DNA modification methylase